MKKQATNPMYRIMVTVFTIIILVGVIYRLTTQSWNMLATILILTGVLGFALFYKCIQWFEKI